MLDDDIEPDDMEPDDLPPFEPDPRIQEMVEYAVSGVELVLNAEFLLDCWVIAALLRDSFMSYRYRSSAMTPEQKFLLVAQESGMTDDDEFGGRQVYGVLLDLYRLRARAASMSDDELIQGILESAIRHWGEEEREDQQDCYIPLMEAREIVTGHLAYAEGWLSAVQDMSLLYKFPTAWSPPTAWVQAASKQFPGLRFSLQLWMDGRGKSPVHRASGLYICEPQEIHLC